MKKLILVLMIVVFHAAAFSQHAVTKHDVTQAPLHFQIHKERCEIRHERNGVRHDFRKFHRYKHFKHKMRKHKRHHRPMQRPGR